MPLFLFYFYGAGSTTNYRGPLHFEAHWKVFIAGAVLFFICIAIFHAETWSLPPEPDPHFRAASRPIWPHLCGDAVSATCLTLLHRPIEPGHW